MRKLLRAKTFTALSLLAILAGASTMQMHPAKAASMSTDPLVEIVVDATSPLCFIMRTDNVGTPAATKTRIPCAPYTLVKTVSMLRSLAIARQEPYALHPNANATQAEWQAYSSRIHQIAESKRSAHGASATAQAGIPAPACSSSWHQDEAWPTINGDNLDLTISWYDHEASGCNHIYLQTSAVIGRTSANPLYLDYQAYDDNSIPEPEWVSWAYIGTNTLTHPWGGYTDPRLSGVFYMEFGQEQFHGSYGWEFPTRT